MSELLASSVSRPDYESKLGRMGLRMKHSILRRSAEREAQNQSKLIPLSNGLPHTGTFPVIKTQFHMRDGSTLTVDERDMNRISDYGFPAGDQNLIQWLTELQKEEHKPPQLTRKDHPEPYKVVITNGIMDALRGMFTLLFDEGDALLTENAIFPNVNTLAEVHGLNQIALENDSSGLLVEPLRQILETWPQTHVGQKRPKALYVITSGHNPSGYTWEKDRLVEVYRVCRKYDVLILEDGAYYYLQFGKKKPSFQSMDVDGRVIRFDTFSKLIGAGYRLGWMSGPITYLDRIVMGHCHGPIHPSLLSQELVYRVLNHWGHTGFQNEMRKIAEFYHNRSKILASAAKKHLTGLATWDVPNGGMFLWLKISGITDSSDIAEEAWSRGVSVLAGKYFRPKLQASPCLRISYSVVEEKDIEPAIVCLAGVIKDKTRQP